MEMLMDLTNDETDSFSQNNSSQRTVQETKGWDVFRDPPIKIDSGSMANQACELKMKP